MAKTNFTPARKLLFKDELSAIQAAAHELNSAFSALAELANDIGTVMAPGIIATIARRAKSLSGGIISIVDGPGTADSLDGQRRIQG